MPTPTDGFGPVQPPTEEKEPGMFAGWRSRVLGPKRDEADDDLARAAIKELTRAAIKHVQAFQRLGINLGLINGANFFDVLEQKRTSLSSPNSSIPDDVLDQMDADIDLLENFAHKLKDPQDPEHEYYQRLADKIFSEPEEGAPLQMGWKAAAIQAGRWAGRATSVVVGGYLGYEVAQALGGGFMLDTVSTVSGAGLAFFIANHLLNGGSIPKVKTHRMGLLTRGLVAVGILIIGINVLHDFGILAPIEEYSIGRTVVGTAQGVGDIAGNISGYNKPAPTYDNQKTPMPAPSEEDVTRVKRSALNLEKRLLRQKREAELGEGDTGIVSDAPLRVSCDGEIRGFIQAGTVVHIDKISGTCTQVDIKQGAAEVTGYIASGFPSRNENNADPDANPKLIPAG